MGTPDKLADRMRAAVAMVDNVAAEVIYAVESGDGPPEQQPAWVQRAGDRLSMDPEYDTLTGPAATVATVRAITAQAASEFSDEHDATDAAAPWLAAIMSSPARPEHTATLRAVLAELLPPYIAAARTRLTPAAGQ